EVPYRIPHHQVQVYLGSLLDYANLGVICDRTPIKISELNIWRRKDCNDMRALAVSRGGRLVSDYYISNSEKLRWRCTEGHDCEGTRWRVFGGQLPKYSRKADMALRERPSVAGEHE